jgi:uncharacterized delta-60 repeat protein
MGFYYFYGFLILYFNIYIMPIKNRLFTYSTTPVSGASQSGNLIISSNYIDGYTWWGGPDENAGYVIAHTDTNKNVRTERNRAAVISTNSVGFWRTGTQSDNAFLSMFNGLFNQSYASASVAAYWLNTNGYWTSYTPEESLISPILVGGAFTSYNIGSPTNTITNASRIIRLNSDGSVDNTFTMGTGFGGSFYVLVIARQTDGKILVGGDFPTYNNITASKIIRLNTDGSIDNAFTYGSAFTGINDEVVTIKIQTDGKILIGGAFTSYNGTTRNSIIRLNSDGTIDNTFTVGTGFNSDTLNILLQSSGKIVIVGSFTTYNGSTANRIIRLNTDGSIDNTFTTGTGFNDSVRSSELQSDDKIIVAGLFTSYNGTSYTRLIRLNSNGTIDNTFTVGTGLGSPTSYYNHCTRIQFDGKILVGGDFTTYNGSNANRIIRLNTDGSVDNTFTTGTGFNGTTVESIFIQSDGKILIGGVFTSYNGSSATNMIRLNIDGTVDRGYIFNSNVKTII